MWVRRARSRPSRTAFRTGWPSPRTARSGSPIAHGSAVKVFEPDGTERQTIPVPLPMVTSLCFGGADRRDLYIVTGSIGSGREDAGTVYRLRVDVAGLPVAPARIKLPG